MHVHIVVGSGIVSLRIDCRSKGLQRTKMSLLPDAVCEELRALCEESRDLCEVARDECESYSPPQS